jgi:hypothetical protein
MKNLLNGLLRMLGVVVVAGLAGGIAGTLSGHDAVQTWLNVAEGQVAQAKTTFLGPNEVKVEVPSVVRGRQVTCFVFVDTKRRISAVAC